MLPCTLCTRCYVSSLIRVKIKFSFLDCLPRSCSESNSQADVLTATCSEPRYFSQPKKSPNEGIWMRSFHVSHGFEFPSMIACVTCRICFMYVSWEGVLIGILSFLSANERFSRLRRCSGLHTRTNTAAREDYKCSGKISSGL